MVTMDSYAFKAKYFLKRTVVYSAVNSIRNIVQFTDWHVKSQPIPPPSFVKQRTVREYARRFDISTLVETGTLLGDMVYAQRNNFKRIFSIEINEHLYELAKRRFQGFSHICIIRGDSSEVLKEIIRNCDEPWLFWLDAHYSGGVTGKGRTYTPVLDEVKIILSHHNKEHVVLIDDARDFTGSNEYPSLSSLHDFVMSNDPECTFDVKHDIIRIHKREHA